MTTKNRSNRKAHDVDLVRLNSLGYSLNYISEDQGCHPSTVTLRLKALGITPADTRRTFMEDVYRGMSSAQLDWIASQLGPHQSIKDYIRNKLTEQFIASQSGTQ